jgi:Tol biopolymer transport system component
LGAGTQINPYSIAFNQDGALRVIDVAVVNGVPQGLNARTLADAADCGGCETPQWSPLGDEIAVGGELGLFVVDAVSGTAQVVYTPPAGRFVRSSAWSPDGSQLAFEEHIVPGYPADPVIKILDLTTNPPTVTRTLLQGQFALIHEMDWARTQDTLAFTGDGVIYTLNLSLASPVPAFLIEGRSPSWSPDDTKLAFEGGSPQPGLKILTLATGAVKRIVGGGGSPDWRR